MKILNNKITSAFENNIPCVLNYIDDIKNNETCFCNIFDQDPPGTLGSGFWGTKDMYTGKVAGD